LDALVAFSAVVSEKVAGEPIKGSNIPIPIGSMVLLYMVRFTINIPPMLAYIPYMDPMGYGDCNINYGNYVVIPIKYG
jgi:hypothetical protein